MTRDQIVEDLLTLVLRIANELPYEGQDRARAAEWHYVKGIASSQIMALRDRLLELPPALMEAFERSGRAPNHDGG